MASSFGLMPTSKAACMLLLGLAFSLATPSADSEKATEPVEAVSSSCSEKPFRLSRAGPIMVDLPRRFCEL